MEHSIPLRSRDGSTTGTKDWSSSRIVHLPRLRKLDLTSSHFPHHTSDVFAMLSHLRLLPTTSVSVRMCLKDLGEFRGLRGLLPQDTKIFPFLVDATSASVRHGAQILIFAMRCHEGTPLSVRYEMCAGGYMQDVYPPDAALLDFCTFFSSAALSQLTIDCDSSPQSFVQASIPFPPCAISPST